MLDAVAGALQLDDTERAQPNDLARAANTAAAAARAPRCPAQPKVRLSVQHLLAAMAATPAFVRNHCFGILAVNALGAPLYSPMFAAQPSRHQRP